MLKYIKNDFLSGIVVFLVALPLCLGISLASGVPFFSGIISGVIGGIVVGFLSNSNLSVSGPAAGLVAVTITSIATLGGIENFALAIVICGLFQILLGMLKAGIIANYFPSNVIKGMLTGIGIIIILKQIPHAVGYDKEFEGDFTFEQANGENTFTGIFSSLNYIHLGATLISILGILIIILFESKYLKKISKIIPSGLAAVIISLIVSEFILNHFPELKIQQEHLVNLPSLKSFSELKNFMIFPNFSHIGNSKIWIAALTICAVASIETLLCIEAIDNLDPQKRITNTNRELMAQGIGNSLTGLIGGLPITSVIVRSSANLNANAKSKLSAILHGFFLFSTVLLIPQILNKIPLSALASILIFTGYKLCKPSIFKSMFKNNYYQWLPFIITVLAVVLIDLLKGVTIGLIISVVFILIGNFKNSFYLLKEKLHTGDVINIKLSEEVSFLNKPSIRETLDQLPENCTVIIDASNSTYIDYDVLEIIQEFKDIKAPFKNINCQLINFKTEYKVTSSSSH